MKLFISLITIIFFSFSPSLSAQNKVVKTNAEWKKILTPEQYNILREKGTERPFSGKLNPKNEIGTYYCAACGTPLFASKNKFDSGTGWPSFDTHIKKNVAFHKDYKYGILRTEVVCNVCNGHLGHIFMDGPAKTTGKRYCVNAAALKFKKD